MNKPSEFELDQDLQMLPAWARQPASVNRYANYASGGEPSQRGRGDQPLHRERPRAGGRREPRPGPRGQERFNGPLGAPPGRPAGRRAAPEKELEEPLPEVLVNFLPEKEGVELLARQIRLTGRAYPLFQIASLILKHSDRFHVQFHVKKGPDGQVLQPLFVCSLDETVWLSEEEVAQHVLRHHFNTFYQTEKVPCDPPKGTYTLVAQCGLSGVLLGPPNYHDYQNKLRKLHSERFAHMPFEAYKARVKIIKDEAAVKKWVEEQSWKAEYIGLNLPEPIRFAEREQVEQHFRATHLPNLVKNVEGHTLSTPESQRYMSRGLRTLWRRTLEEQRRFPLKMATQLSQQLAGHGLQFFKVNKTVVHVCVARPHYLDLNTSSVSDRVRRIIEFIAAHPGCNRRQLIDGLAPSPPPAPVPAPSAAPGDAVTTPASSPPPTEPPVPGPTQEQMAIITDLHWLIHQGHVIEFTDGRMETAPPPKPKPAPAPKADSPSGSPPTDTPRAATPASREPGTAGQATAVSAPAAASAAAVLPPNADNHLPPRDAESSAGQAGQTVERGTTLAPEETPITSAVAAESATQPPPPGTTEAASAGGSEQKSQG